jgi:uncharacterized protein YbbC (DUF1343 family)
MRAGVHAPALLFVYSLAMRVSVAVAAVACTLSVGCARRALIVSAPAAADVRTGLEVALSDSLPALQGKRLGLITNHSGTDARGRRDIDLLFHAPGVQLVALFGPEHGIGGTAQAGDRVGAATDTATGLPVYSLYGDTRVPTAEMLRDVDALVYDIQDVGARVYTYEWTMALAADAAGKLGKEFIVLDRPDPIRADVVGGGVLDTTFRSFVGQYDVALRYGLTPGELLRWLVGTGRVHARVRVIPMAGYRRAMWFGETGLPWLNPSPNIRDPEAALLYPGTVFFEATNVSEGRGTEGPFKQVGAPWLTDADSIAARMNAMRLPGVRFESRVVQVGTADKFGGQTIPMVRLIVTDRERIEPIGVAARLMREIYVRHSADWRWGGDYVERLSGSAALRRAVEQGGVDALLAQWASEARAFQESTRAYWLYP